MAVRSTKYRSSSGAYDWADLPCELIVSIFEHLDDYLVDQRRAASVCVAWRRAGSLLNSKKPSTIKLPFICTCRAYNITTKCLCGDYDSVLTQSSYYLFISRASNHTQTPVWLIRTEEIGTNRWLLRPVSSWEYKNQAIHSGLEYTFNLLDEHKILGVAELHTLHYIFDIENDLRKRASFDWTTPPCVRKVISVSDLGMFLVLFGDKGKLALWSENSQWSYIDTRNSEFDDIIYLRDQLYAIDTIGRLVIINPTTLNLVEVASPPNGIKCDVKFMYFLCSDGYLYLVYKGFVGAKACWKNNVDVNISKSSSSMEYRPFFERNYSVIGEQEDVGVFMFDKQTRAWVRVQNIGNKVFFITKYVTFSVTAKELGWSQGSFIYYMCKDFHNGPFFGKAPIIYKVEGNVCRKQERSHSDITNGFDHPPNWICPMLHSSRKIVPQRSRKKGLKAPPIILHRPDMMRAFGSLVYNNKAEGEAED